MKSASLRVWISVPYQAVVSFAASVVCGMVFCKASKAGANASQAISDREMAAAVLSVVASKVTQSMRTGAGPAAPRSQLL